MDLDDDLEVSTRNEVKADGKKIYVWEEGLKRTWTSDLTDQTNFYAQKRIEFEQKLQKRFDLEEKLSKPVRKGLSRYMFLLLDFSRSALTEDPKPSRLRVMQNAAIQFTKDFFDQNPISQLGVVTTTNSLAFKLTDMIPNTEKNIQAISTPKAAGKCSLQNGLEVIRINMNVVPKHGSREVLVLWNSMSTCDPDNIFSTIQKVKEDGIQVSVIGFGAEVFVLRKLATETGGTYNVALDEDHYSHLLASHIPPPPASEKRVTAALIKMGFPNQRHNPDRLTLCACHCIPTSQGYFCPQCGSKSCELPAECPVCGLSMISSPHLARSYHHLFPVLPFKRVKGGEQNLMKDEVCCGCQESLDPETTIPFQCPKCLSLFCLDCDAFVHESLHNCPTCEMKNTK